MREQAPRFDSMWLVVVAALILYVLPWVINRSFALSIGAYDIAELIAKRPFDDITYYTTLALRGQLVLLTWLLALSIRRPLYSASWWAHLIGCGILVIAQLPPLTFINNTGDMNQQQQAILAGISLAGVIAGMTGYLWQYRFPLRFLIALTGVVTVIYSMIHAIDILNDYNLVANAGIGGIGLVVLYALLGIISLMQWSQP